MNIEDFDAVMMEIEAAKRPKRLCRVCELIRVHPMVADVISRARDQGRSYSTISGAILRLVPDAVMDASGNSMAAHFRDNHAAG